MESPTLPEHEKAQTIFILAIVGIFVPLCAPIAWYLGASTKKAVLAEPGRWTIEGKLKTGTLLAMILTILQIVGAVVGTISMVIFLSAIRTQIG